MKINKLKILGALAGVSVVILSFQNCSPNSFNSAGSDLGGVSLSLSDSFVEVGEVETEEPEQAYDYSDFSCPAGYIKVPPLGPYAYKGFCVAKYEMKDNSGAKSQAAGSPWVNVSRSEAQAACKALGKGFDLISNNQWQAIARNVADVAANWGTNNGAPNSTSAYVGSLSRGVHMNPSIYVALAASENDDDSCYKTGQYCAKSIWNSHRRIHTLSNGEVIWDMAGNVFEWVKDDIKPVGKGGYMANIPEGHPGKKLFGNDQVCDSPSVENPCGFGFGWLEDSGRGATAVRRGGYYFGIYSGVFVTSLDVPATYTHMGTGFRCAFQP